MSETVAIPRPELLDDASSTSGDWIVIVFDNDVNTWDEVIMILQRATACSLEEAQMETWEVHHLGRSIVHHGDREECERAGGVIRTIGIRVEIEKV
jgi:ATP-dependent Clp protease adapter protein ClpS